MNTWLFWVHTGLNLVNVVLFRVIGHSDKFSFVFFWLVPVIGHADKHTLNVCVSVSDAGKYSLNVCVLDASLTHIHSNYIRHTHTHTQEYVCQICICVRICTCVKHVCILNIEHKYIQTVFDTHTHTLTIMRVKYVCVPNTFVCYILNAQSFKLYPTHTHTHTHEYFCELCMCVRYVCVLHQIRMCVAIFNIHNSYVRAIFLWIMYVCASDTYASISVNYVCWILHAHTFECVFDTHTHTHTHTQEYVCREWMCVRHVCVLNIDRTHKSIWINESSGEP